MLKKTFMDSPVAIAAYFQQKHGKTPALFATAISPSKPISVAVYTFAPPVSHSPKQSSALYGAFIAQTPCYAYRNLRNPREERP